MNTFLTTLVSKLQPGGKIPSSALTYVKARLKQDVYNVIVTQFKESQLSQVELARRLGKDATSMSRLFAGPANVTVDTLAETVFATTGSFVKISVVNPKMEQGKIIDSKSQSMATPPVDDRNPQITLLSTTECSDANSQLVSI